MGSAAQREPLTDRLALEEFRVLDLSQGVAGPYCTRILAGLGADVIKVERPGFGDLSRRLGKEDGVNPNLEDSSLFLYLNAGKRSVELDLASDAGKAELEKIAAGCDLVVTSFLPPVAEKLG